MKKAILFLVVLFATRAECQSVPVLYGVRNLNHDKLAIFFDREGTLYPEYPIPNDKLAQNNASLKQYFKNNAADFLAIAAHYDLQLNDNSDASIALLNDAVLAAETAKINNASNAGQSVTFLVHGFRKPFVPTNGDSSSVGDFDVMEKAISTAVTTVFVEVYWDGNYDGRASASGAFNGDNERLLALFEATQANANFAGDQLKKVLSKVSANTLNVVSHSMGARVLAHALLNINNPADPTPANPQVNIMLVAPAIGGGLFYDNYGKRNSVISYAAKDNYNLTVVYNEKDFVLLKRVSGFGPGAFNRGDTSLGCNKRNRTIDFGRQLSSKFPNSNVMLKDLTDEVWKNHLVKVYFQAPFFQNQLKGILK